jgi:hypothetical protein
VNPSARPRVQAHPDTAARFGVTDVEKARLRSAQGEVEVALDLSRTASRPGAASLTTRRRFGSIPLDRLVSVPVEGLIRHDRGR